MRDKRIFSTKSHTNFRTDRHPRLRRGRYRVLPLLLGLLAGAQTTLAFAPFNHSICAFIGPAILLAIWLNCSPKQALWRGLWFGIGLFSTGVSWVYISIHTYGNAPVAIAAIITGLFILVLALFPALNGYLLTKLFKKNNFFKLVIIFPLFWVICEILRSWIFTGFPWLLIGYSQISTPLRSFAPILGVFAVSFVTIMTAATIIYTCYKRTLSSVIISIVVLILIWGTGTKLLSKTWTHPAGKPIQVALLQGNIPLTMKWNPLQTHNTLATYQKLTAQNWNAKLIVWPEGAIPVFKNQVKTFLSLLKKKAIRHKSTIITGVPTINPKSNKYYNSMITIGKDNSLYQKRRLVPFGEYLPFKPLTSWLLHFLKIPMSNFSAGANKQPPFAAAGITIAPAICYEIAYPTLLLRYFPQAELIITISEDSWFGHSIAAAQHLQMAQMRSLETGRYQLVATNSGLTAIIDPQGHLMEQATEFKRFSLAGTVYPMQGKTPWLRLANF